MPVLHCLPGDAFVTNRMPLSGKVPVLNLLTGQKIRFFGSKGRIVAPIDVKLGRAELYHHAKFVKDRTTRAGCRCENVVFVFLFFFCFFLFFFDCHAPSPERRAFEGCIVRTRIALPFIGRFRRGLQGFFRKGWHFQIRYLVLTFHARWRHNFR